MRVTAFVVVLMLAGCLHVDNGGETSASPTPNPVPPLKCVGLVCLANASAPLARYAFETFGLRQITEDEAGEPEFLIQGVWVVIARDHSGIPRSGDLYAYNLATGELLPIDEDEESHAILPVMVGDTVQFYYTTDDFGGAALWSVNDPVIRPVDIGVNGSHKSNGFDGEWITFQNGFSANASEDGYWAYNIKDQRRVFLYQPHPRGTLPDGSHEIIAGAEVHNGTATYALARSPASTEGEASPNYNSTIHTVNLETGERKEYTKNGLSVYRFSQGARYIAIESGLDAWSLDLWTGEFRQHDLPDERCGFPSSGGDWVAFRCFETGKTWDTQKVFLAKPATGERIQLQGGDMAFSQIVTDGESVVVKAGRNQNLTEPFHLDLYWAPISELKGT